METPGIERCCACADGIVHADHDILCPFCAGLRYVRKGESRSDRRVYARLRSYRHVNEVKEHFRCRGRPVESQWFVRWRDPVVVRFMSKGKPKYMVTTIFDIHEDEGWFSVRALTGHKFYYRTVKSGVGLTWWPWFGQRTVSKRAMERQLVNRLISAGFSSLDLPR